jgi:dienelactone hydrolase
LLNVFSDWDGVNFFEQQRATMVAKELGWIGFAADIYGPAFHTVDDLTIRRQLATMYRNDTALFSGRIQAAVDAVKTMPGVDTERIALAGYCFGGSGVLIYALLGLNDVAAIVSIHGGLAFNPPVGPPVGPKLLVLSGGDDDASSEIMDLENAFDSANATWEITRYSNVQHAFSVFSDDRYNAFVDMRSTESMYEFLQETFDEIEFETREPDEIRVEAVPYEDVDGAKLQGYLAMPSAEWKRPLPAVVIFPDWDGVNDYEKKRATMLADMGYVAFAADIVSKLQSYIHSCTQQYTNMHSVFSLSFRLPFSPDTSVRCRSSRRLDDGGACEPDVYLSLQHAALHAANAACHRSGRNVL